MLPQYLLGAPTLPDIFNACLTTTALPPGERDVIPLGIVSEPSFLSPSAPRTENRPVKNDQTARIQDIAGGPVIDDDELKAFIRLHFVDKVKWDIDVEVMTKAIWDFDLNSLQPLAVSNCDPSGPAYYTLPLALINEYRTSCGGNAYWPLAKLTNSLLEQTIGADPTQRRENATFNVHGDLVWGTNWTRQKPDMSFGKSQMVTEPHWNCQLNYIEVRKTIAYMPELMNGDVVIDATRGTQRQGQKRKREEDVDGDGAERPVKVRRVRNINISKNKAQASQSDADEHQPFKGDEVQSVTHINEIMSHGVRSFGTGWLIQGMRMRLWYVDRMGIALSKSIEFLGKDLSLFLLIVAAMGKTDVYGMGIFPSLRFMTVNNQHTFWSYGDARFVLKARRPDDPQGAEEQEYHFVLDLPEKGKASGKRAEESRYDEEGNYKLGLYTECGAVGRGTTIIPIKAIGDHVPADWIDEPLAAKVAWPPACRDAEDAIITTVRAALANKGKTQYLKHVVDLKCSITRRIEDMNLPRVAMGFIPELPDLRHCRTMILKRYEPLDNVGPAGVFKRVFIDVVRAHHWVYETSGFVQRDINIHNIMIFRAAHRVIGVLCDWDLAQAPQEGSQADEQPVPKPQPEQEGAETDGADPKTPEVEDKEKAKPVRPRHRVGLAPFMALELLHKGQIPFHCYRHDLESFFYVLVYVYAVYDPDKLAIGYLKSWHHPDIYTIGRNKEEFLLRPDKPIGDRHPTYKKLFTKWVRKLGLIFHKVAVQNHKIPLLRPRISLLKSHPDEADDDDLADLEDALQTAERERDTTVTYEKFMEILGVAGDVDE